MPRCLRAHRSCSPRRLRVHLHLLLLRRLRLSCASAQPLPVAPQSLAWCAACAGAGKSSLLLSLLRVLRCRGGIIAIDGCDIARVPLRRLRVDPNARDALAALQRMRALIEAR